MRLTTKATTSTLRHMPVLEPQAAPPAVSTSKQQVWLAWLLVPCLFLVMHAVLIRADGPYYLGSGIDPDYAYLCNSLNMAVGRAPNHIDHPGTSVQLLGAAVITLAHPFVGKAQKIDAVLKNPEQHLKYINYTLVAIYAFFLAFVGITVWRRTGDWQSALLLQAAPWLLGNRFRFIEGVRPESLILLIGLLIATVLFLDLRSENTQRRTVALLAFLAATGVITKMNFFPMAFVPLAALRNWVQRATFLLCASAFGFIWLLPVASHTSRLVAWFKGLAFRRGFYGYGEVGILPDHYLSAYARLLTESPWLSLLVGLSWATMLYGCILWKRQSHKQRRCLLLLGGLALGQTLQLAIVAKFGAARYLLPAFVFCPLNLLLLIEFWGARVPRIRWALPVASAIALLLAVTSLPSQRARLSKTRAARMQIARALEDDFKDEPRVFCYGSASLYHALWFGNYWAGEFYTKELTAIFGSHPTRYVVHFTRAGFGDVLLMSERKSLRDLQVHPSFLLCGRFRPTQNVLDALPSNKKVERLLVRVDQVIYRVTFE